MGQSSGRFVGLDGLRGVAAIFVLSTHVAGESLFRHFPASYLAVDFFFVLSGFVLAHAYLDALQVGLTPLAFMRARLLRLYPLYCLGMLLGAFAYALRSLWLNEFDAERFLASSVFGLLFAPTPPELSVRPTHAYPLNIPAWSLFFELFINFAFAVLAAHLTRLRLMVLLAVSATALVADALFFHSLQIGFSPETFFGGFARVTFAFFCGVALHGLWKRGRFDRLRAPVWLSVALLVALFAIPSTNRELRDPLLALLALPFIVALASVSEANGAVAQACLLLGGASYAFYVLHEPLVQFIQLAGLATSGIEFRPTSVQTIAIAATVLIVALMASAWFDAPVRRWLTRRVGSGP